MNSFSPLHEYDLKIRLNWRDLGILRTRYHSETPAEKNDTCTHVRKQMWLPDAHLHYLSIIPTRPCVAVFMLGAVTLCIILRQMHQQNSSDAPTESRGYWYHQNPLYTHRILFALTAWSCWTVRSDGDKSRKRYPHYWWGIQWWFPHGWKWPIMRWIPHEKD